MFYYCTGIRLNMCYQEATCPNRDGCPYYLNTNLITAMSHPEAYVEADTYNSKECTLWQKLQENR